MSDMDHDELESEVSYLQIEANICDEAFDRILAAKTIEEAHAIVRLARQAISDGDLDLPTEPTNGTNQRL